MKKNLLSFLLLTFAAGFLLAHFHYQSLIDIYQNSPYLSQSSATSCEEIIRQYEDRSESFVYDEDKFAYWKFCIAKNNLANSRVWTWLSVGLGAVLIALAIYLRKINYQPSLKVLLATVTSPLLVLLVTGGVNFVKNMASGGDGVTESSMSFYLVFLPVFVGVLIVRLWLKRNKS
jgi:hypothetical protein